MEKQEFCMEKSQIFQEMISRISKLSQDSYLMVTDMLQNFWGFHRDGVKMDIK